MCLKAVYGKEAPPNGDLKLIVERRGEMYMNGIDPYILKSDQVFIGDQAKAIGGIWAGESLILRRQSISQNAEILV